MKKAVNIESFLVFQATSSDPVEFWLDWLPEIDGDVLSPPTCLKVGEDLLIEMASTSSRRLKGIDKDVWMALIENGGKVLICGPSGVLATHDFSLSLTT